MQQRFDACLLHEDVGDVLEHLGIEGMAQGLRFRHRGAHCLGALLEFDADPLAIDGVLVPVPREAFDAETPGAVEESRSRPRARGREGGRESARTAADDQHVGLENHVDRSCRFRNGLHRCAPADAAVVDWPWIIPD